MPHLTRRGFTLIELAIAIVLLGIVTAAFYRSLTTNQRVYQQQAQVIDLRQNMRAAAAVLPAELREIDATEGDILAMGPDSIMFRAHRWTAFMCEPPVTPVVGTVNLKLRTKPIFGRAPAATDYVVVRYEGDDATRVDDTWIPVTSLAMTPSNCPDGAAAVSLQAAMVLTPAQNAVLNAFYAGDPVLGYETVTYGLYQPSPGDTARYIGLTKLGGTPQRLVGPLLPGGLTLTYYDSAGVITADPDSVARIDITLRAMTNQAVRTTAGSPKAERLVDSLHTSVALRNNRRF